MSPRAWSITIPLPVSTVNAERSMHHHQHRTLTREYRRAAWAVILQARIPKLDRIAIEATPFGPRIRQDVAACLPSAKAAIDALVDAHVLADDTPDHVCRVTFHQPRRGPHGLHLLIVDLADEAPDFGTYQAALAIDA